MHSADTPALIEVSPEPSFLEQHSDPKQNRYVFAYTITLRNVGEVPARLLERHWRITHGDGRVEEVRGPGVVGDQPLLAPGESYTYSSGAVIPTPVGTMQGDYLFTTEEGKHFIVPIPRFTLSVPRTLH
ncbi:MAG: Co2+/Mg2+ efflux protein ApaG [Halothiobacillaceae bacterium]|nr:MAG: Co2+/Mg2+ efflux protein ApaG [Halothiobacillaceae bacterium]